MNEERSRERQQSEHEDRKSHAERKRERKRIVEQMRGRAEENRPSQPDQGRKLPLPE